jgi:hypothetical protein
MHTELAEAVKAIPAYCTSGHGILTPAQWATCAKAGWQQPATGAANLGFSAGHNVAPWALLAGLIIGLLWLVSRASSRSTATSN